MKSLVGRTLKGYKIGQEIGKGGMGVVYRARDLDLDRDVAVKFLSGELASNADRLAMFRTEAKSLASLSHPNIASIYRIVKTQLEGPFLVLELIDGATLASRLQEGPIPLSDTLDWCSQIADALDAAHRRGVIHRDLKPGNVMITSSGRVKVLDFGLARRDKSLDRTDATASSASTRTGLMPDLALGAGTPGYASPEQILGLEQDARADVFAFGCVLYECLTGNRAFRGKARTDVLAATLGAEPDLTSLPASTPATVRELIEHCLRKEPDSRPSDMGAAHRRILGARVQPHSTASIVRTSRTPHNLPTAMTRFVGRDAEIASCRKLLTASPLVTLVGPGGCGKTRLALRVMTEMLQEYPDGAWFVDLAPLSEDARVAQAVASAMGIQGEPNAPILDAVGSHIASQRVLILLDNCEHLLGACAQVAKRLIASGPDVRVLATSRQRLGIAAEAIYAVGPLETPPEALDRGVDVERFDSVRLFLDRARQVVHGFALDGDKARIVAEICRKLDGMPLAIELAAARVRVLGLPQILSKLDQRFRLLTGGTGEHRRQQTLEATIQWSYDLLEPGEQRLLRLLSSFAGGWTLESATYVVGENADEFEILDSLGRLVEKSLVSVEILDREARYTMLETVRQYARARLEESGESDVPRARHVDFYLSLAEQSAVRTTGSERSAWFARLDRELDNILLALEWAIASDVEKASRLVQSVSRQWISKGFLELGLDMTTRVLHALPASDTAVDRALLIVLKGEYNYRMGRFAVAADLAADGLAIARNIGTKEAADRALWVLGSSSYPLGRIEAARGCFEEGISLARESGDSFRLCSQLNNLADLLRAQGELDAALPNYEESLAILRTLNEHENTAVVLANMAQLLITRGDPERGDLDRARSNLVEVFGIHEGTGSELVGHILLDSSTGLAARVGDMEEAATLYGATEAKMQRAGAGRPHADSQCVGPLIAEARRALGMAEFARAEADGRALQMKEAVAEAGRWLLLGSSRGII